MIEVSFHSKKCDTKEYIIEFKTDYYSLYEKIKDYIIEQSRTVEKREVKEVELTRGNKE